MEPVVSALMVTQPGRSRLRDMAIADFDAQDYPQKELVVVQGRDALGKLRNDSVERAIGDFVIIWDDDDRRDPTCISKMMAAMRDADAVFLRYLTMLCVKCGERFRSRSRHWECSMLARREAMQRYRNSDMLGEDRRMVRRMMAAKSPMRLIDEPGLYTKTIHAHNTADWSSVHECKE